MKKTVSAAILAAALFAPFAVQVHAAAIESVPIESRTIWIDVREPEEYEQGHVRNAVNIPLRRISEEIEALRPDKRTRINLYCRSGNRAAQAVKILEKMGYTNVVNHGSYEDLAKKGIF